MTAETHIGLGLEPDDPLFIDDFVREAEAIFDRAEAVADTPAILHRVEMARLPIMYLACKRMPVRAKANGTVARFTAIVEREGVTHFAEAVGARQSFYEQIEAAE